MSKSLKSKPKAKESNKRSSQLKLLETLAPKLLQAFKAEPSELTSLQELLSLSSELSQELKDGQVPEKQHAQVNSWLDWVKETVQEYGPLLKEAAKYVPELLAML